MPIIRADRTKAKSNFLQLSQAKKVIDFLNTGYDDYIASRVLLNAGLLSQGAILASTSIEKYIKAFLAIRGNESRGHLKQAHWNALKNYSERIYEQIDFDFLELCQKSYKLRYFDELPVGFNLVIAQFEFMSELDKAIALFENSLTVKKDGESRMLKYAAAVDRKDQQLTLNNYIFAEIEREDFLKNRHQLIYEIRVLKQDIYIEFEYLTVSEPVRKGFLREGCVTSDFKTFHTSFEWAGYNKKRANASQLLHDLR